MHQVVGPTLLSERLSEADTRLGERGRRESADDVVQMEIDLGLRVERRSGATRRLGERRRRESADGAVQMEIELGLRVERRSNPGRREGESGVSSGADLLPVPYVGLPDPVSTNYDSLGFLRHSLECLSGDEDGADSAESFQGRWRGAAFLGVIGVLLIGASLLLL